MDATTTRRSPVSNPSITPSQIRLGLMVTAAVVTLLLFIYYFSLAVNWLNTPFLGATVNHTMTVNSSVPSSNETWTGRDSGLLPGDQIISIDDVPVFYSGSMNSNALRYDEVLGDYSVDDVVSVEFQYDPGVVTEERSEGIQCASVEDGGLVACKVDVTLMALPGADALAFFITPFIAGVLVLGISVMLIFLRPQSPNTFTAVCVLLPLSLAMGGIFDVGSTHVLVPVWLVSGIFVGINLVVLGLVFPSNLPAVLQQPWLRFIPVLLGAGLSVYAVSSYSTDARMSLPVSNQVTVATSIVGLSILGALMGFYHRRNAATPLSRDQANVVFMGVLLGLAPGLLWIFGRLVPDTTLFAVSIEATMPFLVTPAISIAYAVLQYNVIDTDRVLSQSITYGLLFLALAIGYGFLVLGATLIATDTVQANNPLFIVLTIFTVSLLFVPMRTVLQRRIDNIYFRTRRDFQTRLETFSQKLTSLAGPNIMIDEFRTLLDDTIKPVNTLIFLRDAQSGNYIAYGNPYPETDIVFTPESGVVDLLKKSDTAVYLRPGFPWPPELHLDKARLGIIKVMIIAGMAGSEALNGFVAIGPPRSKADSYKFEELRFVNNLVGQLSIAVERATVIQSLERSVQELEVLSQVSQAVNFAIDPSDQLELISAQTLKLINSPFFYIVLSDSVGETLYYAFFLEYDERYADRENRKWSLGNDLYSDVVRSGQPMRVDDYSQTMSRQGYQYHQENKSTRAWMAVPLLAGARTIGLIAVGESDPQVRYSPEQLKIFTDIGSLAAASLDKARLFTEANARARQLTVLNDIARQLVASEGDAEQLLVLITTSAVDILNAEAGSLLLTVDDGSGDLEFKVAVGGTGDELVGRRLEAGFGLVGRVAKTGRPVISNDTTTDEEWEGEVAEEGFKTRSVLAVPLIAQDRVIGVLEVINKIDGTLYVEEDVELLTTFAGQAAIAFENARLYEQTDLQLAQRVRELEALERIDRELNRNLDLSNVAEITVRYAVAETNATSGLLGMVNDDNQHLVLAARHGYEVEDFPEGSEDNLLPLGRGIVRRVMRTRRPDLQPYVDMDPDYILSLRGSLSQITIPIMSGDEVNAILILETNKEPRLNLLDQDWAQRLAEHASIAIENAQLYEEITRANKSKSKFMGFAAHELKNPLTSIKGYAATLGSSMASAFSSDQVQQFASIIQNNADRMQNIIDDLRDIARDDAGQLKIGLEPTELRQVVLDTLITLQKQIDSKKQTIVNSVDENLPLILGDRQRLTQIMVNFVSNAHKYSPEGATITLTAEVLQNYINKLDENIGPVMHVKVQDTGIGMSEDSLNRLFREDYFRSENETARAEEGTGLGMIITKRLIESHDGEVWVESVLGEGSTFQFVVPLAKDMPQETSTDTIETETKAEASD